MKNEREKNTITQLLYETDGLLTTFSAVVISTGYLPEKGNWCALDRTAFFPEGGGQPSDTGYIEDEKGRKITVTDVQTVDGTVCHFIDKELSEGERITGSVDETVRYPRMQSHGAEHLVSGIIHNMFGYDNVGFHMSKGELVLDINGPLSDDDIRTVEEKANMIVLENVPVTVSFPTAEEAQLIDYRSKLDISDNIRLVTIEGYDVCACCAPHLDCTGRFGVIKITGHMPHRGGTRITMTAGMDAYRDYVMLHDENAKIMELLSSKRDTTANFVKDQLDRTAALKEEMTQLKKKLTQAVIKETIRSLESENDNDGPVLLFPDVYDAVSLREFVNACTGVSGKVICAFLSADEGFRYIFAVRAGNEGTAGLNALTKDFNEKCCGKGGGSEVMVQGTVKASKEEIVRYFEQNG